MNDSSERPTVVRAAILGQAPMFRGLSDNMLRLVAEHAQPFKCDDGETIYCVGSESDNMLVIGSGTVAIYRGQAEVAELTRGDTVGEVGVVLAGSRMATVVARSEISGYTISKVGLDTAFSIDVILERRVLRNVVALMADRLGAANRQMEELQMEAV